MMGQMSMSAHIREDKSIETSRLVLRPPVLDDAQAIFETYASDACVTRLLSWPTHRSIEDTVAFLTFSEAQWKQWPAGPYVMELRDGGRLVGSTGFAFESPTQAQTGYVLARDLWGLGYASEALNGIVTAAPKFGVRRLFAVCHPDHLPSRRVLEKCGFAFDATLPQHCELPNLKPGELCDVVRYVRVFG